MNDDKSWQQPLDDFLTENTLSTDTRVIARALSNDNELIDKKCNAQQIADMEKALHIEQHLDEIGLQPLPEGLASRLQAISDTNNKSNIIADYAIVYDETDLIDLRGNVVLSTHQKDTLFAQQLYYDQKKQWLFTNVPVKFRTKNELINGNGFDSNRDFTNAQVLEVTGKIYIDE